MLGSERFALIHDDSIYVFELTGTLHRRLAMPFPVRAIVAADPHWIYVQGDGKSYGSAILRISVESGEIGQISGPDGRWANQDTRHGAVLGGEELLTVPSKTYQIERWRRSDSGRGPSEIFEVRPAVLRYLAGAYDDMEIVRIHLVEGRFLWLLIRLALREPPSDLPEAVGDPFGSVRREFDGLIEVVDIEREEVRGTRFIRDLEFSGWISGAIGYTVQHKRDLRLVHTGMRARNGVESR